MKSFKQFQNIEEMVQYHVENEISLLENVFRVGSEHYFETFNKARTMYYDGQIILDDYDLEVIETDIGEYAMYEGEHVPLDCPLYEEDDNVELNKPKRGGSKKYYVYVKTPKGNVKKISFGDVTGLKTKASNKKAAKSFAARHNCEKKNDKQTAGYWACRLPRYGLVKGGKWW